MSKHKSGRRVIPALSLRINAGAGELDPELVKLLLDFQDKYGGNVLWKAITTFLADASRRLDPVMQKYASEHGMKPDEARAAMNTYFAVTETHHGA